NVVELATKLFNKISNQAEIYFEDPATFSINNSPENREITKDLLQYEISWANTVEIQLYSWNETVTAAVKQGNASAEDVIGSEVQRFFLIVITDAFQKYKIALDDRLLFKERGIVNNYKNITEVAGGFLFSVSVLRLSTRWPRDLWDWISISALAAIAVILLFFALLDIGNKGTSSNLVPYILLEDNWLIVGEQLLLLLVRRRYHNGDRTTPIQMRRKAEGLRDVNEKEQPPSTSNTCRTETESQTQDVGEISDEANSQSQRISAEETRATSSDEGKESIQALTPRKHLPTIKR
ncbi:hypothetical protein BT69DRAFT_1300957, partial [Atractiella rhizophila]